MARALDQAAWPAAACDRDGGLWLAFRSYPVQEAPEPPMVEIRLASSWNMLHPAVVATGRYLSPPALAIGCDASGEEQVLVAWADGSSGPIRSVTASRSGLSPAENVPVADTGGIMGLTAGTDSSGRAWLAWQEVQGRTSVIRASRREAPGWTEPATLSDSPAPASDPALATDPAGGLWICWCQRTTDGFTPMLRHLTVQDVWGEPIAAANGAEIDLEPALDVDARGRVYLIWRRAAQRWGTMAGARLNEETHLYARVYDPATREWRDLAGEPGAPLPAPTAGRFAPIAGRETLEHWACPIAPRIFVDAEGGVRVLFRRYRDVHGVYDWGFDLYAMAWDDGRWSEPIMVSHAAGFPERQYVPVRMADGGAALVYQYAHCPPIYWHCPDDWSHPPTPPSGIAITRLAWGGKVPPVRQIGPGRPEALRAGEPSLAAAKRLPTANPQDRRVRIAVSLYPKSEIQNPISPADRCFFGDVHCHSNLSFCMINKDGSLEDQYRWARDLAGHDFYGLTDHVEDLGTAAWERSVATADSFDRPGAFTALYGMEYTNKVDGEGKPSMQDLCLFTAEPEAAWQVWHFLRGAPSGEQFLRTLLEPELRRRIFLVRHFHGGRGYGLDLAEPCNRLLEGAGPGLEPVLEIVQHRGPCVPIIMGLLASGQRKGVIGGTDHGRPGPGRKYVTALTGIWAAEMDRQSLVNALFHRRSFATNGPRMTVDFTAAGACMGGEADASGAFRLDGFVQGTSCLQAVTVYRDSEPWMQPALRGDRLEFTLKDRPPSGTHFYWVHAAQAPEPGLDYPGEVWSSPVWVST